MHCLTNGRVVGDLRRHAAYVTSCLWGASLRGAARHLCPCLVGFDLGHADHMSPKCLTNRPFRMATPTRPYAPTGMDGRTSRGNRITLNCVSKERPWTFSSSLKASTPYII